MAAVHHDLGHRVVLYERLQGAESHDVIEDAVDHLLTRCRVKLEHILGIHHSFHRGAQLAPRMVHVLIGNQARHLVVANALHGMTLHCAHHTLPAAEHGRRVNGSLCGSAPHALHHAHLASPPRCHGSRMRGLSCASADGTS